MVWGLFTFFFLKCVLKNTGQNPTEYSEILDIT